MISLRITLIALNMITAACSMMVDKNSHDYPQASKDAFIASCMARSSGQQAACSCMLGKVQEHYTYGQMADLEEKMKAGQTSQEDTEFMKSAMRSCVNAGTVPQR
jgi:hypothetical protein